jgi:predicted short-subunit dehydrogenase-like oxidoreductase (DUF2520 family)
MLRSKMRPMSLKTLNMVGAGRVGRTLAALWQLSGVFEIQGVLTRSPGSAREAVAFIGAGSAADAMNALPAADVWLLAVPDGQIAPAAERLAASGALRAGDMVFHCSGALPSGELDAVRALGAHIASVHPLKSFADAADAVRTFAGTYCVAEGDAAALALLGPAFERIGARMAAIDARFKTVYHAGSVMVCNYLTALMEAGLQCFEKAGLPRNTATEMMEPLVRETLDNVFRLGTQKALTGPIARGDHAVVARQLAALLQADPRLAAVYQSLGMIALGLAAASRVAKPPRAIPA